MSKGWMADKKMLRNCHRWEQTRDTTINWDVGPCNRTLMEKL